GGGSRSRQASFERAYQQRRLASGQERLLETPRFDLALERGAERGFDQVLGALGVPATRRDLAQIEVDLGPARSAVAVVTRVVQRQEQRPVGLLGEVEISVLERAAGELEGAFGVARVDLG